MVTTLNPKTESSAVVAAPVVEPAAAAPASAPVDVSAVPETPAELLKQWDTPAPRRPLIHTVVSATLVRIWDTITGPGRTEQERTDRKIFEHNRYLRAQGPPFLASTQTRPARNVRAGRQS